MDAIVSGFIRLFILVISIALHEFGHAAMATKQGDPTPRLQGRLTLNPVAHFDPLGFVMLCVIVFAGFGFAWGKPVQTNPLYYPDWRKGILLTALAGPAMNLCLAMLGLGSTYLLFLVNAELAPTLHYFLANWLLINIFLLVFNMLPIPPLDGGNVLRAVAPQLFEPVAQFLSRGGFILLLVLLYTGVFGRLFNAVFMAVVFGLEKVFGGDFVNYLFSGL